jgi:hypothetical protein
MLKYSSIDDRDIDDWKRDKKPRNHSPKQETVVRECLEDRKFPFEAGWIEIEQTSREVFHFPRRGQQ